MWRIWFTVMMLHLDCKKHLCQLCSHRNPGVSCCGGKQECTDTVECLRYPESLWTQIPVLVTGSFRGKNTHWETNWGMKRVVWQDNPLRCTVIFFQHVACVFSLYYYAPRRPKKEIIILVLWMCQQQHFFWDLTLSKELMVFVFSSDFQNAVAVVRPAVLGSANSLLPFVTTLACAAFCFEPLFLLFFLPPKKKQKQNKRR